MKKDDSDYSVGKAWGNCNWISKGTKYEYREGTFTFTEGVVSFYDEPNLTTFSFIYNGRIYGRSISDKKNKQFTDKSLIIQAGKFGREIVNRYKTPVYGE